ncbi:MAG: diacylglycerol kinase family lipid kinase [Bacteroidales bacterium]|jgi:YegS/Rv2252/BmrU family lipid kinase|nr:diacylglycerol kinase family lipid kinase [Bacteroidales bacterium]
MEKICFIINPVSGTQKKDAWPELIRRGIDGKRFDTEILFTERQGHAHELAFRQVKEQTPYVVAVGGDGTVNEVAAALRDSNSALGILPSGSGNGLARHLHIPLRLSDALKMIGTARVQTIDYGLANDKPFFCTLGAGFDAHVSEKFAHTRKRGFRKYVAIIAQEFILYRPQWYKLKYEGKSMEINAMLVTVANSSQYGNNGYISPLADISDGQLDICILLPFPKILAPALAARLVGKTIHKSPYYRTFRCRELSIVRSQAGVIHMDGDPCVMDSELYIKIVPGGLKVLTG